MVIYSLFQVVLLFSSNSRHCNHCHCVVFSPLYLSLIHFIIIHYYLLSVYYWSLFIVSMCSFFVTVSRGVRYCNHCHCSRVLCLRCIFPFRYIWFIFASLLLSIICSLFIYLSIFIIIRYSIRFCFSHGVRHCNHFHCSRICVWWIRFIIIYYYRLSVHYLSVYLLVIIRYSFCCFLVELVTATTVTMKFSYLLHLGFMRFIIIHYYQLSVHYLSILIIYHHHVFLSLLFFSLSP